MKLVATTLLVVVAVACKSAPEPTPTACTGSTIQGMRDDPAHHCAAAPVAVGCGPADQACGDAITYAVDPDGNGWWFADTCIPDGWTAGSSPTGDTEPPATCP
jgi:hypothetical protein